MTTFVAEAFADDPVTPHSAQFPLSCSASERCDTSMPSAVGVRPWNLRSMRVARHQGDPVRDSFYYDHAKQLAVDKAGFPLTLVDATANKVTSNDGDEGPSEDFTYDYAPDAPVPV